MIVDLPDCSTRDISKRLVRLRSEVGAMTIGRVMTLLVVTDDKDADAALAAATEAGREHPSRIIAVVRGNRRGASRMDAQVRMGGEAGVSEVVVLRLYGELAAHGASVVTPLLLPDSPIVAWWPMNAAENVAESAIGRVASRRITDASLSPNPRKELVRRRDTYAEGDTDMAWARTTRWRGLLATALDQPPYEPVTSVTVAGASDSASTDLLAGWLAVRLGCPVYRARGRRGLGLISVRLERPSGPIDLVRAEDGHAELTQPGQPVRRIALHRPGTAESLAEELRRLDKDEVYREALLLGLPKVIEGRQSAAEAARSGDSPVLKQQKTSGKPPAGKGAAATPNEAAALNTPPARKKALLKSAAAKPPRSTGTTQGANASAKSAKKTSTTTSAGRMATTKAVGNRSAAKKTVATRAVAKKAAAKKTGTTKATGKTANRARKG